jgi:uracil-DNA glycosylase
MNLEEFHKSIADCSKCALSFSRTQVVPGSGNPDANIMFIGEAPGKNEDLKGEPFIGAAGKVLNEMLEEIGLKREDIFIANTIKCRPPDNRDPLQEEIDTCFPYLKKQILFIKPKIIVSLGRFSLNLFFPEAKIGKVHGQILQKDSLQVLALYHPAAALYNRGMRETLQKDFQILKKFI